ncbi:MAG TPA: hypothetical protein VEC13_02610, partial [Candidatus Paceibacterota bacterium]|nr:hypothetical protein [Candidatus Paceibacterota bacterium]
LKSADMPHAASFNFPTVTHHTACSCLHDPFETLAIQVDQDDVEKTIKLMNDWVDSIAPTSIRRGSIPGASPISSGLHNFPCMYVHKSTVVEKNRLVEAGVPKDISYEKALARCYQAGLVNEKTAKNRKATHDYRLLTREEREAEVTERLLKDEEARAKIVGLDATTEDVAAAVKMTFLKRLNRRIETYGLDKNHIAFALKKVN